MIGDNDSVTLKEKFWELLFTWVRVLLDSCFGGVILPDSYLSVILPWSLCLIFYSSLCVCFHVSPVMLLFQGVDYFSDREI